MVGHRHVQTSSCYAQRVNDALSESTSRDGTAAALRAETARANISGRELARRLGKDPAWVSRRLAGSVPVTVIDLHRIAKALNVDPAHLMPPRSTP